MNEFIRHLEEYGYLSTADKALLTANLQITHLPINDYFLEAGQVCHHIAFIVSGVLRVFFYDREGNERSRYFVAEGQYAVDLPSFNSQTQSSEYIQAVTDCTLVLASPVATALFEQQIPQWSIMSRKILEASLLKKVFAQPYLLGQDATTRYLAFLEQNPALANRIALAHLASYLNITPQSLSRIRRQVAESRFLTNGK